MQPEISRVVVVQLLIPLVGLLSGVFWKFTDDPHGNLGYRAGRKFEERLQSETNELGDIALQVANLAETDDDRVDIAADHAVAIVMRGAFDDSLPNAEKMFSAIDPNVASQQQSVREKIKAYDRGQRMHTVCARSETVWKVVFVLLIGLFIFISVAYGLPVLYPQMTFSFTAPGVVSHLSTASLVLVIVAYLTGVAWLAADHKLGRLLHEHGIPKVESKAPADTSSDTNEE